MVQPDGDVVVPYLDDSDRHFAVASFVSRDGGATWSAPSVIAQVHAHPEASLIRNPDLLSAEVDAGGRVYLAFSDCRFEPRCAANDIVYATSTDGLRWSRLHRVPTSPVGGGLDVFTPGLGLDRSTGGAHARIPPAGPPAASSASATCPPRPAAGPGAGRAGSPARSS